jgi:hypothetical protein
MSDVPLSVIDRQEVGERPVIGFTGYPELRPFSTGTGELNLLCGVCGFVLVAGTTYAAGQPRMLIRCPACGGYNDLAL